MDVPAPSPPRRVVAMAAAFVPLVVDPFGADTLVFKQLALGSLGLVLLGLGAVDALRGRPMARPNAAELLLGCLAGWMALSLTWAQNPALGVPPVLAMAGMLGVARTARLSARQTETVRTWLAVMVGVGVLALVVDSIAVWQATDELAHSNRKYASWLFRHNNMAANFAALIVPLAGGLALTGEGRSRWPWVVAGLASMGFLVMLRSRAGLVAALAGVLLLGLLSVLRGRVSALPRPGRRMGMLVLALTLGVGLLPASDSARGVLKSRFYALVNVLEEQGVSDLRDAAFRTNLFRKSVEMWAEDPLLGVGAGNFPVVYPRHEPMGIPKPHAHNDMLHILAEAGLPGVLLFAGLMGALAWSVLSALTASARRRGVFLLVAAQLGALGVLLLCGLFEVPFSMAATSSLAALVIGLLGRLSSDSDRAPAPALAGVRVKPAAAALLVGCAAGLVFVAWRLPASRVLESAEADLAAASELAAAGDADAAAAASERARGRLERLAALPTGSPLSWTLLGRLDLARGDASAALARFAGARARAPFTVEPLLDEGEALLALGRTDEALERYRTAVTRSPGRRDLLLSLVVALSSSDRRQDAIDLLQHQIQSRPRTVEMDVVLHLATLYREQAALMEPGPERVRVLVAARHFYAVVLQDGTPGMVEQVGAHYRHVTHQLQLLEGSPDSWWKDVYEPWLVEGAWQRPNTALWSSLDEDGRMLYPGWEEAAGPPLPRAMR